MVQNNQEPRLQYWATCSSVHSFARTTHSFACSGLLRLRLSLCSLVPLLAHFARSLACGKLNDSVSQTELVLSHSALIHRPTGHYSADQHIHQLTLTRAFHPF